jgi:HD-GYP domain-containing protein (c-di-GMP phosphodiesterase class II)
MLKNNRRQYEMNELNRLIFDTVTSFYNFKVVINDLRSSSTPHQYYQKWSYYRQMISADMELTLNDPRLASELERYRRPDILPGIRLEWGRMINEITMVDSQLLNLIEIQNQSAINNYGNELAPSSDYNAYLEAQYRIGINNLYVLLSNAFEDQLYTLNHSVMANNKDVLKYFNRLVIFVVLISIIILFISLTIIFNRMNSINIELDSQRITARDATINALAYQAELRDDETGKHIERTAIYIELLAQELAKCLEYKKYLSKQYIGDLKISAPLHDIGKVGISDNILLKPGPLSADEFKNMQTHTILGAKSLRRVEANLGFTSFLDLAIELIESHHEKWDGTGYPHGLRQREIPLSGRLMALADVYDALRSKRVYKPAFSHAKCVEIIRSESAKHFDPQIVSAFLSIEADFNRVSLAMSDG